MKNLHQIIMGEYLEESPRNFDSYGKYLIYLERYDEFYRLLSDELKQKFDKLLDLKDDFDADKEFEICEYTLKMVKKLFSFEFNK